MLLHSWAVEKLHAAGILVMNMIGAPKHVKYALGAGVDIICAQGGEGGGVCVCVCVRVCARVCVLQWWLNCGRTTVS